MVSIAFVLWNRRHLRPQSAPVSSYYLARNWVAKEAKLIKSKLKSEEWSTRRKITVGFKNLKAYSRDKVVIARFHVPRGLSCLQLDPLSAGLKKMRALQIGAYLTGPNTFTAAQIPAPWCTACWPTRSLHCSVCCVVVSPGSSDDDFRTLFVRVPPSEVQRFCGSGDQCPSDRGQLLQCAAAPWYDAAPRLRSLAFALQMAGLYVPSRKTAQLFGGNDANHARASALACQAFGVQRGLQAATGLSKPHRDVAVPTLVSKSYIEGQQPHFIKMGRWVSPVTLPRKKHCQRLVDKGPWAGFGVGDAFVDGLERLFQLMSEHLAIALVAADKGGGLQHMQAVPKCARLGGDDSVAIQTTFAYYYSGVLLAEAEAYVSHCRTRLTAAQAGSVPVRDTDATSPGEALRRAIDEKASLRLARCHTLLPAQSQRAVEFERQRTRPLPSRSAAAFTSDSLALQRICFNRLVANGRIGKAKEVVHLHSEADADEGETRKGAGFMCEAFKAMVGRPVWLPPDFDIHERVLICGAAVSVNRLACNALHLWLDRRLATLGRLWKRIGYKGVIDAIRTECSSAMRPASLARQLSKRVFERAVHLAYDDHLTRTAGVLYPGCFFDDSRTLALFAWLADATRLGLRSKWAPANTRSSISLILVASWVALQLKPEAFQAFLVQRAALIQNFQRKGGKFALIAAMREWWAQAPANAALVATLQGEDVSEAPVDTGCQCLEGSGCVFGRRAQERAVKVAAQRAQGMSYHRATKKKGVTEISSNEACRSADSLQAFLRHDAQMSRTQEAIQSFEAGGERALYDVLYSRSGPTKAGVKGPKLGLEFISDVRANMMARLVFYAYWYVQCRLSGGNEMRLPHNKAAPCLAKYPSQRVLAFVEDPPLGASLSPSDTERLVAEVLARVTHLTPMLVRAWAASKVAADPELATMVNVLVEEMCLSRAWDVHRWEEVCCEVAKGLVGMMIHHESLAKGEAMKGGYAEELQEAGDRTTTGWPPVAPTWSKRPTTYINTLGQLVLRLACYLPCLSSADGGGSATAPTDSDSGGSSASMPTPTASCKQTKRCVCDHCLRKRRLQNELERARDALEDARSEVEAAQVALALREEELKQPVLREDARFRALCDFVCRGDARLALHLWRAWDTSLKASCGLHLDDLDAGHLLNFVFSYGLNATGGVVQLSGCLLMVILRFADSNLASAEWSGPDSAAHDRCGNILLLEPTSQTLALPAGWGDSDVPDQEDAVIRAVRSH